MSHASSERFASFRSAFPLVGLFGLALFSIACGGSGPHAPSLSSSSDSGASASEAVVDGSTATTSTGSKTSPSRDASVDSSVTDAGSRDASVDSGARDAGVDAGSTVADSGTTSSGPTTGPSIEVARTQWGNDYVTRPDAPQGGTLFSVWTKIPDPGTSYPWSRGNMDVYVLRGSGWHIRFIVGNSSANSSTDARYNANSMLFADPAGTWVADYSYYESGGGHAEAPYRDWVWAAWQVVVSNGSFTLRQWLKLGPSGAVFAAGTSTVTFDEVRTILTSKGWSAADAAAWSPSDATDFQVGYEHGYLTRARMEARSTVPTLAELETIARHTTPDAATWADYPFVWSNGAADLHDQSGHGRNLLPRSGGTLYQGVAGPSL